MHFLPLTDDDWRLFLRWAADEGWTIPLREQLLFQGQWRPYFFALHLDGEVRGFVSAVAYKESGWIGNLLVDPEQRGRGYGALLFDFAVDLLRNAGRQRVWLTASVAGQPLYLRRGFVAVDTVERWSGLGLGRLPAQSLSAPLNDLIALDAQCWQESRASLLLFLADEGQICRSGNSVGLLQPGPDFWQFGPWLTSHPSARENRLLLAEALGKTAANKELFCDVLLSAEIGLQLRGLGFEKRASNLLMCQSSEPVSLSGVVALASLGSIG